MASYQRERWEKNLALYKEYRNTYPNEHLQFRSWDGMPKKFINLRSWVRSTRCAYKAGRLKDYQNKLLDDFPGGFPWNVPIGGSISYASSKRRGEPEGEGVTRPKKHARKNEGTSSMVEEEEASLDAPSSPSMSTTSSVGGEEVSMDDGVPSSLATTAAPAPAVIHNASPVTPLAVRPAAVETNAATATANAPEPPAVPPAAVETNAAPATANAPEASEAHTDTATDTTPAATEVIHATLPSVCIDITNDDDTTNRGAAFLLKALDLVKMGIFYTLEGLSALVSIVFQLLRYVIVLLSVLFAVHSAICSSSIKMFDCKASFPHFVVDVALNVVLVVSVFCIAFGRIFPRRVDLPKEEAGCGVGS